MSTQTFLDVTEPGPDIDVTADEEYGGNSINDPTPSGNPNEDE